MKIAAVALTWWRSASSALPLSVCTTASSITALPSVTCTPSQVAGPERTASSTRSATWSSALRTCTATLAGLASSVTPGSPLTISRTPRCSAVRSSVACGSSSCTKPTSNSEPWLPTRCTSAGSRDSVARSRSARPEMTAVVVAGRAASERRACTDSGSGLAAVGSATIGARVPS